MVLAGAYVDLHEAAEAAPEKMSQVCQIKDASSPFTRTTLLFEVSFLFLYLEMEKKLTLKLPLVTSCYTGRRRPAE